LTAADRFRIRFVTGVALLISFGALGCANTNLPFASFWTSRPSQEEVYLVEQAVAGAEQARLFRRAETERANHLSREIERLQADLITAESALVEAESGLAGSHTRAEAVSSLAVARIQVERAASWAPWRAEGIDAARKKLEEARRQISEGRFGAAIFFVYRARRVAESILDEAEEVMESAHARLIRAERVNLRAGPSTEDAILSVLESGTPVIPQTNEGEWMFVQVTGGPAGWVHRRLLGGHARQPGSAPASPLP
jgi:hypothetical protein